MPRLVKMYIRHVMIGFALSALFLAGLLALDVVGLRGLIFGSGAGYLAGVMMWVANGIVFSGVQFGIAIMNMAEKEDKGPRGGKRQRVFRTPAPVMAEAAVRKS